MTVRYLDPLRPPPLAAVDHDVFANRHYDPEAVITTAIDMLEHGLVGRAHALLKATKLGHTNVWTNGKRNMTIHEFAIDVKRIHDDLSAKKYDAALSAITNLEGKSRKVQPDGSGISLIRHGPEVLRRAAQYYRLLSLYKVGRLEHLNKVVAQYQRIDASPSPEISAVIDPIEMIANLCESADQVCTAKRSEQALKQLQASLVLETAAAAVRATLLARQSRIRYVVKVAEFMDKRALTEQDVDAALKTSATCSEALQMKGNSFGPKRQAAQEGKRTIVQPGIKFTEGIYRQRNADVYKILSVDRLATTAQIQQAYKRLSLIKAAFDILVDPDKRARFDKLSADYIPYRFDLFRF
ncbi:hypothetical protein JCM10296v2_003366 [Rhodotorula toruloides]